MKRMRYIAEWIQLSGGLIGLVASVILKTRAGTWIFPHGFGRGTQEIIANVGGVSLWVGMSATFLVAAIIYAQNDRD